MGKDGVELMRTKKALVNSLADLAYEVVAVLCGFILPKLILSQLGSSYNGITSSISQFVSCIALLKSGIGGVTRASLYKPLANGDSVQVSRVVVATEKFMRRIALLFSAFLILFACIYPYFVSDEFEWFFSFSLVLIIGASTVIQYYFGMTYQMLLQADQKHYVYSIAQIVATLLNTVVAAILIRLNNSIHIVKLGSTVVYILIPVALNLYVSRHYEIDKKVEPDNSALSQRWDAFALQLANFVNNNTDLVILTVFTNVKTISVYTVYHLVLNGLQKLIPKMAGGVEAALGNILAKNENEKLKLGFSALEYVILLVSTVIYTCVFVLILPFVRLYTSDVSDVNYIVPSFAFVASLASFFYCVRTPYQYIVQAAGHFRQTRNGSFVEAGLNIVLSIVLVAQIGITGVAVGTLVAMLFRTVQYASYSYKYILKIPFIIWIKKYIVSAIASVIVVFVCAKLHVSEVNTAVDWCVAGIVTVGMITLVMGIITAVFYRAEFSFIITAIRKLGHKKN